MRFSPRDVSEEIMAARRRYRKKADHAVVAVQLDLDTGGFTYNKWGADQTCKRGDWLVDNEGDVYTVDSEVFARTYRKVSPGVFVKTTPIWADIATEPGSVLTNEGESYYKEGDYLVSNNEDGTDAYFVSAAKFKVMYEPDE
jgi:hypothetical protein